MIYLSTWSELKKKLNKEKEIVYKKLYQHFQSDVQYYTLEVYCDLLHHCGYIEFDYRITEEFSQFIRVIKIRNHIPETLTIKQATQMKKHPWMQWFLEVK